MVINDGRINTLGLEGYIQTGQAQKAKGYQEFAFDSAIAWREYAGYLETQLNRFQGSERYIIANDVLRTHPPKRVERTVYE